VGPLPALPDFARLLGPLLSPGTTPSSVAPFPEDGRPPPESPAVRLTLRHEYEVTGTNTVTVRAQ
jgi:hypothetical protein